MPYLRKYASKRKSRTKRSMYRKKKLATKATRRLYRSVKALRPELKFIDLFQPDSTPTNGASAIDLSPGVFTSNAQNYVLNNSNVGYRVFLLNNPNQGINASARLGNSVKNKFLRLRMSLTVETSSGTTPQDLMVASRSRFRIMIVSDRSWLPAYETAFPQPGDVLEFPQIAAANDSAISSPKLVQVGRTWGILYDKIIQPNNTKGLQTRVIINKKLIGNTNYQDTPTGSGTGFNACIKGGLYLIVMFAGDTGAGGAVAISSSMDLQSRFYFTDA